MSSNVLQPNPPHLLTHTHTHRETPNDTFPQMPFLSATPQKISHLHHYYYYNYNYNFFFLSLSKRSYLYLYIYIYTFKIMFIFFPDLRGLFGLCIGQSSFFTEKTGNKARTFSPSLFLSLFPYLFHICLYSSFLYSSCSYFPSFLRNPSFP